MARDKAKDDKYFNCSENHELVYVSGLYVNSDKVKAFLKEKCADKTISYSTHMEVYELIEKELDYSIPI
jgi:hypothetical protein